MPTASAMFVQSLEKPKPHVDLAKQSDALPLGLTEI